MGSTFGIAPRTHLDVLWRLATVFSVVLVASWPASLEGQDNDALSWHVGSSYAQAFGGWGWGLNGGVASNIPDAFGLPSQFRVEAFWTKPALSGSRTFGVPHRRVMWGATADVRARIVDLPGTLWVEVGVPIGLIESRVGEPGVTEVFLGPSYNTSGSELGAGIGVLGGAGIPLSPALALTVESKNLLTNLYADGFERWIGVHELGVALSVR